MNPFHSTIISFPELTCAAATTVAVNYVIAGLSYDETTGIEQIKADFTEAVRAVYAQAKTEGVLRYNDVRPLISAIAGVEDFETFTMNGKMQNITLKSEEYPDTGKAMPIVEKLSTMPGN